MIDSFFTGIQDAGAGILSALRISLLEVGSLCDSSGLCKDDFQSHSGAIYSALMEAWMAGEPYDFIRLVSRLRKTGDYERLNGSNGINEFFAQASSAHGASDYIQTLLDARAARRMHELGSRLIAKAFDPTTDVQELLETTREELSKVNSRPDVAHRHISHFANQIIADLEEPEKHRNAEVIEIGLGIDEAAGPFERGDLLVIAGCTKGGKSALAGNIIEHTAKMGRRSALFSFEMTGKQNVQRMLASQSIVNIRNLRKSLFDDATLFDSEHSFEKHQLNKVRCAAENMKAWKVEIFERPKGIDQVTSEMARMKALGGLDVALIDYAQLVRGLRSKGDSREREVASISYELKQACMKHECLGILLSQLTVDSNGSAHLRESRALGQDANCVLFIEGDGKDKQLRVVAARSAPSGTIIDLLWEEEFTRFSIK